MRKLIPLAAIAGAFAALAAAGGAQATPASTNLAGYSDTRSMAVEQVGWRRNKHGYRRHQGYRQLWWSPRRYKHRRRWH